MSGRVWGPLTDFERSFSLCILSAGIMDCYQLHPYFFFFLFFFFIITKLCVHAVSTGTLEKKNPGRVTGDCELTKWMLWTEFRSSATAYVLFTTERLLETLPLYILFWTGSQIHRLVLNSLCSWEWPQTSDHPVSISTPSLCWAGVWTQDSMHARQAFYSRATQPPFDSLIMLFLKEYFI